MSSDGIVVVLGLNRASVARFVASIADKRSLCYTRTILSLKTGADCIALQAGLAVSVTDHDLVAGIHLLAMKAMNTEVVRIDEASSMVGVDAPIELYFF